MDIVLVSVKNVFIKNISILFHFISLRTNQQQMRYLNNSHILNLVKSNSTTSYSNISHRWLYKIITSDTIRTVIKTNIAIWIYGILVIIFVVLSIAKSLLFFKQIMMVSRNLHAKMLSSLLRAPINFFTANTAGHILNRFSRDLGIIDETIPIMVLIALQVVISIDDYIFY